MCRQPDAQAVTGVAVQPIREQDAGVMPFFDIGPVQLGQTKEGTGLQQSGGQHQVIVIL